MVGSNKVRHYCLQLLLSIIERIIHSFSFLSIETFEYTIHLLLYNNPKELHVLIDMHFEDIMCPSPSIAWEDCSYDDIRRNLRALAFGTYTVADTVGLGQCVCKEGHTWDFNRGEGWMCVSYGE